MVLVDTPLEGMLEEIGFQEFSYYDILSPSQDEELFESWPLDKGALLVDVPIPDENYLEQLCNYVGLDQLNKLKLMPLLIEVLLNASERGNKLQEYLPISVKVFSGSKGQVIRIRDSGSGFDSEDILQKMRNEEVYFETGGRGLFRYQRSPYKVNVEGENSAVNIMINS